MKKIYDDGSKLFGTKEMIVEYINKCLENGEADEEYASEVLEELRAYKDETNLCIDYDNPMGFVISEI